jgi:hypothetical protein
MERRGFEGIIHPNKKTLIFYNVIAAMRGRGSNARFES